MKERENLDLKLIKEVQIVFCHSEIEIGWFKLQLCMLNKMSDLKKKLSDNNLASELVEKMWFLTQS